jgi:hypothetical protein
VDFDATLITAHSDDKDGAAPTYKRTWGFHPFGCWLDRGDGTGERWQRCYGPVTAVRCF